MAIELDDDGYVIGERPWRGDRPYRVDDMIPGPLGGRVLGVRPYTGPYKMFTQIVKITASTSKGWIEFTA